MQLYGRRCSLIVDTPTGQQYEIDQDSFRFQFSYVKTSDSKPNKGKIKLYNAPKSFSAMLLQAEAGTLCTLRAGYEKTALLTAFKGNIAKAVGMRQPPNQILELELQDGGQSYRTATTTISAVGTVDLDGLVRSTASKLGVAIGEIGTLAKKQLSNGFSFTGLAKDAMDVLVRELGAEWSVQDGQLQVISVDQFRSGELLVLTPDTGLLLSPIKQQDKGVTSVSLECLLLPAIQIGCRVIVESRDYSGTVKVNKIDATGDTGVGSSQRMKLECSEVV